MSTVGQDNSVSQEFFYCIHCIDDGTTELIDTKEGRFGGSAKRMQHYVAHKEYMKSTNDINSPNYIKKIAAGPLESDDGRFMIGDTICMYVYVCMHIYA